VFLWNQDENISSKVTSKYGAVIRHADIRKTSESICHISLRLMAILYKAVPFVSKLLRIFTSLEHVTVMSCW